MTKLQINIQPREVTGKQVKNLRAEGSVPASLYGPKYPAKNFAVNAKEFRAVFAEAGYSNFVNTEVDGDKERLLVKEVQKNPVTDEFLHVSFYVVDRNTKITAEVPVVITGLAPAQDSGEGFVVPALDAITIHCLPDELPSEFSVDISNLVNVGDSITVADIKLPEGVELDSSIDETTAVVYISGMQKIEEEAPAVELDEEGNPIVPEGEEGAEGAAEGEGAEGEEKSE